jgi:septum formation protein
LFGKRGVLILQRLERKNQSESVLESPDMKPGNKVDDQLYLASNSPRRKELLSLIGWKYATLPMQVDETPQPSEEVVEYVKRLALCKASTAADLNGVNGVIIAADTTVVDFDTSGNVEILGKPGDSHEAIEILHRLRGHNHRVFTAISIIRTSDGTILSDLCATDVPMRDYTDEEIDAYVASGDPLDKAGAYAIQNHGFHPVEKLYGCYANVMGLPLCHLTRNLSQLGLAPHVDVPQVCQAALEYDCPVFPQIFAGKA